ncbi:MAG: DUF2085 domain-containing protein [Melioribacteraceae bacterium]|nr:DUF2085 domain-containing protein [Melioribacteraceae bacterium]
MNKTVNFLIWFLLFIWLLINFAPLFSDKFQWLKIIDFISGRAYSLVCHRVDYKLICCDDGCTLLCARCTGIYSGAFFASTLSLFTSRIISPKSYLYYLSIFAIVIDIIFYNLGVYDYNIPIAFSTGIFFGSLSFLYIRNGVEKLIQEFR